jgi:hypothetical protein
MHLDTKATRPGVASSMITTSMRKYYKHDGYEQLSLDHKFMFVSSACFGYYYARTWE